MRNPLIDSLVPVLIRGGVLGIPWRARASSPQKQLSAIGNAIMSQRVPKGGGKPPAVYCGSLSHYRQKRWKALTRRDFLYPAKWAIESAANPNGLGSFVKLQFHAIRLAG